MKWIKVKSEKDLPKGDNLIWIVRTTVDGTVRVHQWTTGHLAEIALLRNKNTYSIEWLDESINQEGSLRDWKEKLETASVKYLEDKNYSPKIAEAAIKGFCDGAEYTKENVLAPLLQNELKGDDLVAEASNSDLAAEATLHSSVESQIEQEEKHDL